MEKNKIIFLIVIIILSFTTGALLYEKYSKPKGAMEAWSDKEQLEYVNMLLTQGLKKDAAEVLEKYIDKDVAGKKELAKMCFQLGNIYLDLCEYEKALKAFYKAKLLDKDAPFKDEMGKKINETLERARIMPQTHIESNTQVLSGASSGGKGEVVAKIGNDVITMQQIENALDMLPPEVREELKDPEAKLQFIREYVITEALYRKAKEQGGTETLKTREYINSLTKQFIAQNFLQKKIEENLKISQNDLEAYYKRNINRFTTPEAVKISYIEVENPSQRDWTIDRLKKEAINRLKEKKGIHIEEWIERDEVEIPGIGEARDTIVSLLAKEKGNFTDVVTIDDKAYVFCIDDKRPKVEKTFDELRNVLENEYRLQKQDEIVNSILDKTLEEEKVEILYNPAQKNEGR